MESKHFNNLSPAEHERLSVAFEEFSEAIQVIGKIMRHGYESTHPNGGPTNRELLEEELGHVRFILSFMEDCKDINIFKIEDAFDDKASKIQKYLHHNIV